MVIERLFRQRARILEGVQEAQARLAYDRWQVRAFIALARDRGAGLARARPSPL